MKEEIIGGLRNALERGETIEKAMQSFMSAGYSAAEVREAAGMINPSAASLLYGQPATVPAASTTATSPQSSVSVKPSVSANKPASPSQQSLPAASTAAALPMTIAGTLPTKGRKTAIILAIVLIVLVLVLGATLWFSKDIIAWFSA